jgi:hypothetical protein
MKVVYVKGMSLPKNCGECVFNRYRMMGKGKCVLNMKHSSGGLIVDMGIRQKWCKLVEGEVEK